MRDRIAESALRVAALSAVGVLALIALFIVGEGAPVLAARGPGAFLASATWAPTRGEYGLLAMLAGSAVVTLGALALAVPLGIACAVTLAELAPPTARAVLKPLVELLAGIPSVVYGFLGMALVVPVIRTQLGGPGPSALAASVVLAVMVLPTLVSVAVDAIEAVPRSYRDGARALGATEWQSIAGVVLPAARSGLAAAVILGIGRAVGETMAVIMVAGNAAQLPDSPLAPVRTLTANVALEMAYATGEHAQALFATAIVLFVLVLALNAVAGLVRRPARARRRRGAAPAAPSTAAEPA